MTGTTLQLIVAAHLTVVVVLLLRPRPARRALTSVRARTSVGRPAQPRADDPGAHLRDVAEAMLDESDELQREAADRATLGLHDDARELRARAEGIDAMTDLVIAEARRLLDLDRGSRSHQADEPAS